jgi:hypothetical protein
MYGPATVSPRTAAFAFGFLAAWGITVLCGSPAEPPPPPPAFFVEFLDSDSDD